MKARIIISGILMMLLPVMSIAQEKNNRKRTHKKNIKTSQTAKEAKPVQTFKTPEWAPSGYKSQHVYFPDYYTFYDPQRGYVTWDQKTWVTSPTMPLFLKNADLKKTRIQILDDFTIDRTPETSYPRYMQMYPAQPGSKVILAPVPKSAGQPGIP